MKVWEFEDAAWKIDGVRIFIRAPTWAQVEDYKNAHAAEKGMTVTKYLKVRIAPKIGEYEVAVTVGDGTLVHGGTKLSKVRASYTSK